VVGLTKEKKGRRRRQVRKKRKVKDSRGSVWSEDRYKGHAVKRKDLQEGKERSHFCKERGGVQLKERWLPPGAERG